MKRCAIYCRYSADMQKESSLIDQEREAREYAERQGWTVVGIYSDAAMSGGSSNRPDFERMKADANADAFDIVLSESIDRLSRNLVVTASLHEELSFLGIRLFTIHQGEINKMLVAMMGMVAEQYVSDLRDKVKRGQRGRVLNGKAAGGVGYGYTVGSPGERTINPKQALIVPVSSICSPMGSAPGRLLRLSMRKVLRGQRGLFGKIPPFVVNVIVARDC